MDVFNSAREWLRAFWRALATAFGSNGTVRARMAIIGAAGLLIALAVTVALTLAAPSAPTKADVARISAPTMTNTRVPTATTAPSATPTVVVHKASSSKPKTPPPPPPPPPPPATPPPVTGNDGMFAQFCGSPTPTAPTATTAPTTTATGGATATATSAPASTCVPCPYYAGNNPSQAQIAAALQTAAASYGIPANLMKAVAWQESRWHEDVLSCDGGIGLMQIQYYTYPWLNSQSVPACHIGATSNDPYTLQGNANLGAKYLAWLSCFYSYWGNNGTGASLSNPGCYTIDWYYRNYTVQGPPSACPPTGTPAPLLYPDAYNADGSVNATSYCGAVFNANGYYPNLPSTLHDPWSCPYTATTGDATLLDITLSAYNEGADYTNKNGIQNWWYVNGVEGWISQFASGALPVPA